MATAYLTGDTFPVRGRLQGAGWRWDASRKAYWKRVSADTTPDDVIRNVRLIGGIRNRGRFAATIEQEDR